MGDRPALPPWVLAFLPSYWCIYFSTEKLKFHYKPSRRWSSWVTAQSNPTGPWLFYLLLVEDNLKIF